MLQLLLVLVALLTCVCPGQAVRVEREKTAAAVATANSQSLQIVHLSKKLEVHLYLAADHPSSAAMCPLAGLLQARNAIGFAACCNVVLAAFVLI